MAIKGTDKAESWESIYQEEGTPGWDIAKPAPPFVDLVNKVPNWLKPGKLISFGAGGGHDAAFFAEQGFDVTAVDFAPSAIEMIKNNYGHYENLVGQQSDIFDLPKEFHGNFDYVLEHTCFCAIPKENRVKYVDAAVEVLKEGGILFGLFYRFDEEDGQGPPHAVSMEQIEELFVEKFEIIDVETPKQSHGKRQSRERLIVMQKK